MVLKEILNYNVYKGADTEITVYSLLLVFIVLLITYIALRIIRRIFKGYIKKQEAERRSYWSVYLILRYVVWVVVIVLMLETSGVKVSVLLASITALLVGVGFGIQQLFSDIASGIVLIFERNLQINDIIELEDDTVGKVIHIGLRTSKLKTRDDVILVENIKSELRFAIDDGFRKHGIQIPFPQRDIHIKSGLEERAIGLSSQPD